MCQLWRYINPAVETGWERSLPVQRLRPLLQDERAEQAAHQTKAKTGEKQVPRTKIYFYFFIYNR